MYADDGDATADGDDEEDEDESAVLMIVTMTILMMVMMMMMVVLVKPLGPRLSARLALFSRLCVLRGGGVGSLSFGEVPRWMSHDSSEEFEDPEELTPWDHRNGPPPEDADHADAPRGPPPPAPVNGPMPAAASAPRATPRDSAAEHVWERDHSSGPQPVVILEADGTRRIARVAGPLLPSGRFEGRSESSSSSSTDGEDDDEEDAERHSPDDAGSHSHAAGPGSDAEELTWSESSLILEGPSLAHSKERLYTVFRQEVQDQAEENGQDLSTRSLAAQVGALRRRTTPAPWTESPTGRAATPCKPP